ERGGPRAVRERAGAPALPRVQGRRRDLHLRGGDRAPLLPLQRRRPQGPHRGRRRLLRGLDG
ncbi:MAG: Protein often found in Actinomycetes clustered with signal peptidase and/or RNaseHII, partial [uncultured Friedmanniella sp.]